MRTSEQTTTLIAALVIARSKFSPITKEATGQVGKDRPYKYADLSTILDATINPLLAQGIAILQAVDAESSSLITRMQHTSGEWVESAYPLKLDLRPQELGSLITYARRYSLLGLLCVAGEDDDGAEAAKAKAAPAPKPEPTTISTPQQKRLFTIAEQAGWTQGQIRNHLQKFGLQQSRDISLALYPQLCADFNVPPPDTEGDDGP